MRLPTIKFNKVQLNPIKLSKAPSLVDLSVNINSLTPPPPPPPGVIYLKKLLKKIYSYYSWREEEALTETELLMGLIYIDRKEKNLAPIERIKPDQIEEIAEATNKIYRMVEKNVIQPLPNRVYHLTDFNTFKLTPDELKKHRLQYLHNKQSKH